MAKLILLLVCLSAAFAKDDRQSMIEEFLKQRERIMNDMMDSFGDDSFFGGQSMFDDDLINKFDNSFFGQNKFSSNVSINQTKQKNGDIKVVITPKSKNIKLDIQTTDDLLTVTSQTLVEQEDSSDRGRSVMKSMSSSSQSVGIPFGYKLSSPKTEGNSVVYFMTKAKTNKRALQPLDIGDSI